ncbi:MAG: hypothetical protein JRF33_14680 [Deltaproteobacteria bacterium]|nr:hypothetical protein [Deltaproteobacteria bacterium]
MRKYSLLSLFVLLSLGLVVACGDNQTFPVDRDDYMPADTEPLACIPNLDGRIEAHELQAAYGVSVSYLISPAGEARAVDLVGSEQGGKRRWDWGADYESDQVARLAAEELAGKWYAADFPAGQFVTDFDAGGTVESVYSLDSAGLHLHGLASAEENPADGQTLMVYNSPVLLYRFPIEVGSSHVSVGQVQNGMFRGLPYAARDTYEVDVDAAGELVLPDVTFTQALRIRVRSVIEPSVGQSVSQRQVSYMFECFGEVARATSRIDEPDEDFTNAIEVRRLGLGLSQDSLHL